MERIAWQPLLVALAVSVALVLFGRSFGKFVSWQMRQYLPLDDKAPGAMAQLYLVLGVLGIIVSLTLMALKLAFP